MSYVKVQERITKNVLHYIRSNEIGHFSHELHTSPILSKFFTTLILPWLSTYACPIKYNLVKTVFALYSLESDG